MLCDIKGNQKQKKQSKAIKSFVTKDLFKEIVKRLKPRNSNFKNKTNANRMLYKKQRYYCVSILRKITTN